MNYDIYHYHLIVMMLMAMMMTMMLIMMMLTVIKLSGTFLGNLWRLPQYSPLQLEARFLILSLGEQHYGSGGRPMLR